MTMVIPYEFDDAEVCHASVNLDKEWRACCLRAMGYYHQDDPAGSGYVNDDPDGISTAPRSPQTFVKIVNLIPDSAYQKDKQQRARTNSRLDPWMEAAILVNESILRTRDWIAHKQLEYASVVMSSSEASLIESTVASFVATTATEIESLRQMVSGQASSSNLIGGGGREKKQHHHRFHRQELEHRSGIVQILMLDLQQKVSVPFQALQKKRKRLAVHVWQNPFECTLYTGPTGAESGLSDHDDNVDEDPRHRPHDPRLQFVPRRPAHRLQGNLWESYHPSDHPKKRPRRPPTALLRRLDRKGNATGVGDEPSGIAKDEGDAPGATIRGEDHAAAESSSSSSSWFSSHKRAKNSASSEAASAAHSKAEPDLRRRRNQPPSATAAAWGKATYVNASAVPLNDDDGDGDGGTNNYYESHRDVLEREAAQLELVAHSDLDAVQQMERHMVDITALLSQFANLVSDQAADVSLIYHATHDAKDNVDQGQRNLLEARERTEASRHYLATAIAMLGVLLLAFHWIRP
jgi:hypothetical protein